MARTITSSITAPTANAPTTSPAPFRDSEPDEESEVLDRLSHDFELCVYGLGEVRREWERREGDAPAGPIVIE